MSKIANMDLEDLYDLIEEKGKATPAVMKALWEKEDFSTYDNDYWSSVCTTPNKHPSQIPMETDEVDVLIIQAHMPFDDKRRTSGYLNHLFKRQMLALLPGVSCDLTSIMKVPPRPYRASNGKMSNKYTSTHIKPYLPYLLHEISVRKPKVIISLDTETTKLLGLKKSNGGNKGNRGEVHISPLLDIPVVITLHMRYTNMIRQQASGGMWGDDYYSVIERDFQKAIRLLDGMELKPLEQAVMEVSERVHVCRSLEDVREWTDVLLNAEPNQFTSWDLETTSLDPWAEDARILTSQVGIRIDGEIVNIVIPLWHKDNIWYDADEAFEIHKQYLLRDSAKVGHNITFDITYLAVTTGVRLQGTIIDTLLALHSMDSGISGCYSLKTAVWDHLLETGLGGYEDLLTWEPS